MYDYKKIVFLFGGLVIACVGVEIGEKPDGGFKGTQNPKKYFQITPKKDNLLAKNLNLNKTTVAEGINLSPEELLTSLKQTEEVIRNAKPSIVPRKGVDPPKSAIHPRKGVEPLPQFISTTSEPQLHPKLEKLLESPQNFTERPPTKNSTEKSQKPIDKKVEIIVKTTEKPTTQRKYKKPFKPKPTATIGGIVDVVKPIVGLPTKTPPLGMSSKINYVMPVIMTILILPIFIIFMIYLYRNGRECWEKRHYRRMDFLIDGMYNE